MNFSTTLLLILALIAANLPFLAERIFFVARPKTGSKRFAWRLLELVVLFFVVGGIDLPSVFRLPTVGFHATRFSIG